jgi:uncharacterized membrane protein
MFDTSHLHPMLVHFPIALVVLGFVAEIIQLLCKKEDYYSKVGLYLLITGTLAAFATLLTGMFFTSDLSGAAGEIQETHELFAWITISLLLTTSLIRILLLKKQIKNQGLQWLAFIIYGLAAIAVSITGFFGGTLVYNYMMPL